MSENDDEPDGINYCLICQCLPVSLYPLEVIIKLNNLIKFNFLTENEKKSCCSKDPLRKYWK